MASTKPRFTTPDRPLTWLITGCSSGLGLELTRQVLAHGHRVIATSRTPSRTPELVREVEQSGDGRSRWLTLDVDDPTAGRALVQRLEADGDAIDVLVNNAGFAVLQTVEHVAEAEARALMETHYFAPLRLVQAVLPGMRRRRFGVIVYVSSGAGLEARPSMGLYGAAKAAGDAMTKTLAREVAPFNIRGLYVSLGSFQTNMPSAIRIGSQPRDADYAGSEADLILNSTGGSSTFRGYGDPVKAAAAIFDVAAAQGVGRGHEAQTLLPLGRDEAVRVREVRDKLDEALRVFGDVCDSMQAE